MRTSTLLLSALALALSSFLSAGCGSGGGNGGNGSTTELDISICAPDAGPFSATIDHPFYLLPVGTKWIFEGEEDGVQVRLETTSLDETEVVAGVTARVVEERAFEDGELHEISRNFFVRAADGTVRAYGEDVSFYENGEVVSHDGAWRAGVNGATPGIAMPATPAVGQLFTQEVAPGVAESEAEIVAAGERVDVPFGTFDDTIEFRESDLVDGDVSTKVFARDAGTIIDDDLERLAE